MNLREKSKLLMICFKPSLNDIVGNKKEEAQDDKTDKLLGDIFLLNRKK